MNNFKFLRKIELYLFLGILLYILSFIFYNLAFANYAVVDFSRSSLQKRFFIYDNQRNLLFATYTTHGSGSGTGLYPTRFSNSFNTHASSLGTYRILEIHYGKHGKSYRLQGLDSTNSNAYDRMIEIHGADYIGNGRSGTSWGCFAVPYNDLDEVLTLLQPGDYLYARD